MLLVLLGLIALAAGAIQDQVDEGACPAGCVCADAEIACKNMELEKLPKELLQGDWKGITKM
jgi:hypothetical protein